MVPDPKADSLEKLTVWICQAAIQVLTDWKSGILVPAASDQLDCQQKPDSLENQNFALGHAAIRRLTVWKYENRELAWKFYASGFRSGSCLLALRCWILAAGTCCLLLLEKLAFFWVVGFLAFRAGIKSLTDCRMRVDSLGEHSGIEIRF